MGKKPNKGQIFKENVSNNVLEKFCQNRPKNILFSSRSEIGLKIYYFLQDMQNMTKLQNNFTFGKLFQKG
jgi:hypothetical protein